MSCEHFDIFSTIYSTAFRLDCSLRYRSRGAIEILKIFNFNQPVIQNFIIS